MLRVDARWSGPPLSGRPVLVIDEGMRRHRQEAMLAPPRPPSVIRGAYPTAADLIAHAVAFMLDLGEGTVIELPAPAPWRRSRSPVAATAAATAATAADQQAALDAVELRREAEVDLLREALLHQQEALSDRVSAEATAAAEVEHQADEEALVAAAAVDLLREQAHDSAQRSTDLEQQLIAARAQLRAEQERATVLAAQTEELHVAIAGLTELVEQEGVHASVLADVVRAETERRELLSAELATAREQLAQLERRRAAERELPSATEPGGAAADAQRSGADARVPVLQERVNQLEARLAQLVGELAFVGAAREDAEQTAAALLAQATQGRGGRR